MKNIIVKLLCISLIFSSCKNSHDESEGTKTRSNSEIQSGLESFIESHNWQYNGNERRPVIAATTNELARLKAAWSASGAEHDVLASRFAQADKAMASPLNFPPEGGQHNQWYQCNACQIGLVTVDAHHHKCPQCGKIYSGFPYDNVLYSDTHRENFRAAEDAAWAWKITGDKKYAEFSARVLLGYAERYLNYRMIAAEVGDSSVDVAAQKNDRYRSAGHVLSQTLDESMIMIPAVTAYDLIYDSKVLTPEDKRQIEEKLIRAMAESINVNKTGKSNWQTWHNAALLYAGVVMGDKQMVKQAMLDDENGFVAQMKISVLPEGMWFENSWGYHYYTLDAMTLIAEGGKRIGMDIYSDVMLKKMYLLAFDYRMADGSLPRFGDAVDDSPDNQSVNEQAYSVYKDGRLLATLPDKPTWEMIVSGRKAGKHMEQIPTSSKVIPGAGHAILATDGPGKLTAALTFGPYGGFHGHFDKLSFVFFGFGEELAVDPGRSASQAYRLPIHHDWYKATTGHNALLVDGKSQKEAGGELLAFATVPSYAAVTADAGPAFENIDQRRFLLLAPTYLLVIDELRATDGQEHTFDWLYHNKGRNASCGLPISDSGLGELPAGYAYLKDIKAFRPENGQPFEIDFPGQNVTTRSIMLGHSGDEVFTATGPFSSVVDRVPMEIVRRKGKIVYFITLLEPVVQQSRPDIRELSRQEGDSLSVSVLRSDSEDRISFTGGSLVHFTLSSKSGSSRESLILSSDSGSKHISQTLGSFVKPFVAIVFKITQMAHTDLTCS